MQGPYGPPPGFGMQPYGGAPMAAFQCRACGFAGQAAIDERVTTAGWVVLVALLFLCFPLFWIPLISMKEKRPKCPRCNVLAAG
jgi:hypothetical protein